MTNLSYDQAVAACLTGQRMRRRSWPQVWYIHAEQKGVPVFVPVMRRPPRKIFIVSSYRNEGEWVPSDCSLRASDFEEAP
jgi:hypothetical protein